MGHCLDTKSEPDERAALDGQMFGRGDETVDRNGVFRAFRLDEMGFSDNKAKRGGLHELLPAQVDADNEIRPVDYG